jgi:two-component system, NarL family, invasion response regulator UvrY
MRTSSPIAIALVDDHTLLRTALADMINSFEGYEVVLEAANGEEFKQAVRNGPPVSIAIVDLHMPVMDGYATIEWLRNTAPGTKAVALTFEHSEEAMLRALRSGACGFLLKDVCKEVFKNALDNVAAFGHCHSDQVRLRLNGNGDLRTSYERARSRKLELLSERESEFLGLVCHEDEYTYDQIADRMGVHRRTVDGFRESVFGKFGIKSKAGLVLFAFKWGIAKA